MNTDPETIRILCYGDSNTWGANPEDGTRYPVNIRWTGRLQENLGNDYEIIEEGLNGRTTVLDDPQRDGRNGKTYLYPCLKSHYPLNLVVLMLGTNDLKERFNLSAEDIAGNIEKLILLIKETSLEEQGNLPKIILISPTLVNEQVDDFLEGFVGAEKKSRQFADAYEPVAERNDCLLVNIADYIQPSNIDGVHFEKEAHAKIAEVLFERVKSVL